MATDVVPAAIAAAAVPGHGPGQDGTPVEVERFASNFLRRQVLRLLDRQPPAMGRPVLVGCGPDEEHELGALLLTLLLRARGTGSSTWARASPAQPWSGPPPPSTRPRWWSA